MTESDLSQIVPGLLNGACPLPGMVTAGQPTPDGLEQLAAAGVRTILDLRGTGEDRGYDEPAAVERAGMRYVPLPVTPPAVPDATFDRFRELLADRENWPVLVHCATSNRVGMLLLPYFALDRGMDPEAALQRAIESGLRSQPLADVALQYVERTRASEAS